MLSEVIDDFEGKEQEESEQSFMLSEVIDVVLEVCDVFGVDEFEVKEQKEGESSISVLLAEDAAFAVLGITSDTSGASSAGEAAAGTIFFFSAIFFLGIFGLVEAKIIGTL